MHEFRRTDSDKPIFAKIDSDKPKPKPIKQLVAKILGGASPQNFDNKLLDWLWLWLFTIFFDKKRLVTIYFGKMCLHKLVTNAANFRNKQLHSSPR